MPARTRCLCCGGTAGSRNVITPVSLGTSAAVKVVGEGLVEALAEANQDRPGHDGKERLLVFSDSRQDAAHQARFIIFASRYDRMRSRMVKILKTERVLTLATGGGDAQRCGGQPTATIPMFPTRSASSPRRPGDRIRAWEEAPLLDEIAVNAGYRGTLVNLGLAYVGYDRLDEYVRGLRRRTGREDGHPAGAVGASLPDGTRRDPHPWLPVAGDAALSPGQRASAPRASSRPNGNAA